MTENYDDLIAGMERPEPAENAPQGTQLSKEEFAAKKQAERESLSGLAAAMEMEIAGDSGKFQQYLDTLARFERYSPQNTILIFAQHENPTRLADYGHWLEAGTPVRRGETGIAIFEPGKPYKREDGSTGVSMNIKKVFDISQTSAQNHQQQAQPARDIHTLLKALMSKCPAPIKLVEQLSDGTGAHYNEQSRIIEVARGLDGMSLFRCLAQEIAYAELDRQNPETLQVADKGFVSYAASYTLCVKHGIEAKGYDFSDAQGYFAGREGKEVRGEIKAIRDVVNEIATRMARELNPPEKKAPVQEARA